MALMGGAGRMRSLAHAAGFQNLKMRGTVGTLGTLARLLGKFVRFSRVPKNAIGTLESVARAGPWPDRMGLSGMFPGSEKILVAK